MSGLPRRFTGARFPRTSTTNETHMALTDEQRYLFDTFGYLVIENAVTPAQVDAMKAGLKRPTEQWEPEDQADAGPLHWDRIWRDLLDLPTLTPVLEELIGDHDLRDARGANADQQPALPTFRLDHINIHTHVQQGFGGGMLHGGRGVNGSFTYHDGRFYGGLTTVSLELYDTASNGGGFAIIPGSHKSNLRVPRAWVDLSQGVADCVSRVAAKPGDAIIFSEACTHGTLPWTSSAPRSTVFYKFSPHAYSWGANFFDPEDYRRYEDMDDRKLALLEPPNARYRGRPGRPARKSEADQS